MSRSPSMVPSQGEDTYLVLDDLGRVGRVWRGRPPKRMLTSKPSSATYLTTSTQPSDAHLKEQAAQRGD
jgi:hypothetical protein